jgi:3-oxoacyl-[acyl-carrier-protein] synthase II
MRRRVVITGLGAVTPLGVGAPALFERWAAGECAIDSGLARCSDFDPSAVMTPKEVRRSARFVQFAVAAADEALQQAGWLSGLPYPSERIGSLIGTGFGGLDHAEELVKILERRGPKSIPPLSIPVMMPNAAAGALAIRYGLRGQAFAVGSGCASGAHAIGVGARMIACGDAEAAVVGGTEAPISPLNLAAHTAVGAMSRCGVSRPFDARRDGFVMGEGAGVLVLEAADAAAARGAPVLAELAGYGSTDDAHHVTAPEPGGLGAARAIALALADAGIAPAQLSYVNAHGTSTPLNDRCETLALKHALGGELAARVPVSSTKSAIGHLIGAAGAVEAISTVLALRSSLAPATLGYEEPDPELDLDFVPYTARPLAPANGVPRAAISNSFGFGGHNVVLCVTVS